MTIKQYKKKFEDLYLKMQEEHGDVAKVVLQDVTEMKRNQMPINANFRIVNCSIIFE